MSQPEHPPEAQLPQVAAFVRFTPEQGRRLRRDQLETGKSIPDLLRTVYFQRGHSRPNFDVAGTKLIRRELAHMGNNLNQLTKRVNSGLVEGARDDMAAMTRAFLAMRAVLLGMRAQAAEDNDGDR